MRDEILSKIRELARANGGLPPGRMVFERETGIRDAAWRGVYWARWGDACAEAGLSPNAKTVAIVEDVLFEKLAAAFRHYGRVATEAEPRMYHKIKSGFPSHSTISNRFSNKVKMLQRMREWATKNQQYADIAAMLADRATSASTQETVAEGYVYLLGSGAYFKIGRSDELERRVKEIRITLPEATTLMHAIRTDDPAGIESYWHRRFADRRAKGEWFKLSPSDVAAFKRRKYQ
jgi:hypothetical protein